MKAEAPECAGFSQQRLERISRMIQDYIDCRKLAGVSATVSRQGTTIYLEKFGYMDIETQKPLQFDTIFRIASMTKPVTTVAAMMLYQEGHFHLNTPVSDFIPGFKNMKVLVGEGEDGLQVTDLERPVTMRHLFTHTSGLCYGWNPEDPVDRIMMDYQKKMQEENVPLTMANVVERLVTVPLAFQPGTRWRYGMNIEVLGHIVEIISGKSLDEFFRTHIFEPLGMPDTGFYVPEEKRDRVSSLYGHVPEKEGLQKMDNDYPTSLPDYQSGGGGLISTLPDYARFLQMLVNKGELNGVRLLSPKTVEMYSINYAPEQALPYGFAPKEDLYHYGYGFSLGTRVLMDPSKTGMAGSVGEFGWDGAFSTYFWVDPSMDLYGLMMLQHYPNAYYPIAQQFKQLTYQAIIK